MQSIPFEEMTPAELDEGINELRIQLSAYRLRYQDGMSPSENDEAWYRRASSALARAMITKDPLSGFRPDEKRRLWTGITDLKVRLKSAHERIHRMEHQSPLAERNAAFVQVVRRELPHPRYNAMMAEATETILKRDAAVALQPQNQD